MPILLLLFLTHLLVMPILLLLFLTHLLVMPILLLLFLTHLLILFIRLLIFFIHLLILFILLMILQIVYCQLSCSFFNPASSLASYHHHHVDLSVCLLVCCLPSSRHTNIAMTACLFAAYPHLSSSFLSVCLPVFLCLSTNLSAACSLDLLKLHVKDSLTRWIFLMVKKIKILSFKKLSRAHCCDIDIQYNMYNFLVRSIHAFHAYITVSKEIKKICA